MLQRIWLRDRPRLAAATVKLNPRRGEIAAAFSAFETTDARERYVEWVEREAAQPAHLAALADIVATSWRDGRRPNRDNDRGSTLLARLDERWLELDV